MPTLKDVQYYDRKLQSIRKMIDHIVNDAKVWDQIPSHRRFGRLEYYSMFAGWMAEVRSGIGRGELLSRQVAEFRNLERLASDAVGTVNVLRERDVELSRLEEMLDQRHTEATDKVSRVQSDV